MIPDEGRTWPLLGGFVVLLGLAVLGGLALSNAGPTGTAVATQSNGTDWNATGGSEAVAPGCPPADALRKEVFDGLETRSIEEVRSTIPAEAVRCLPEDVLEALDLGNETDGSTAGTDGNETGDSTSGVDCPSNEEIRETVETALESSSAATVRTQIPEDYDDCLPADVQSKLHMGANVSAESTATDTATSAGSDSGPETNGSGVDCPPAETIRKDVNRTLEKMSAAQFRTMVPEQYVECFPPDVRERLGLTAGTTTADGDSSQSNGTDGEATDSSTPMADPESKRVDADRDGVVNSADYAPDNASVQFADADGDGVPNPYDYAPRDAAVQEAGDPAAAADPGGDDGSGDGSGDSIPVAAGSALLLVLAAGTGVTVYRHYGGSDSDDGLPQPASTGSVVAGESSAEPHDVFGESAFDPDESPGTGAEFAFDDHGGDDGGFVFDNEPDDEDVITLDSDGSVPEEETGFVFEGGPSPELDDAGEPADD